MDLHELLGTAVADLPDAPDLVPQAQRIHHRRTAVTRAGVVAAAAALVVGAGTLTIASPWSKHAGSVPVATGGGGSQLTKAEFEAQVVGILQSAWPYQGQTVSWDPQAVPPEQDYLGYKVTIGSKSFTIRFMFYGASATEPYSGGTVVPSPCVNQPDECQNSTTGTYAWVQTSQSWQQLVVLDGNDNTVMLLAQGTASNELTKDQLTRLGLSAQMQQIYTDAAEAGLLVYPRSGPIPSDDPA